MSQQSIIIDFLKKYAFYCIIAFGIIAIPIYKLAPKQMFEAFGYSFLLFILVTILSFWIVIRQIDKKGMKTILPNFFLSIFVKMMICLVYFYVMLQGFPNFELEFSLLFFASYFVATGFEVYYIYTNLQEN